MNERIDQLTKRIDELVDGEDENLIEIIQEVGRLKVLNGMEVLGTIAAAYMAGRLRGRQEWTIQVKGGKDD